MDRRDFIKTMLITGTAPAFVRADSLMRISVPKIYIPPRPSIVYINAFEGLPAERDGLSWKTAFSSISEAMQEYPNNGHTIYRYGNPILCTKNDLPPCNVVYIGVDI